jgi:hypothetical protein
VRIENAGSHVPSVSCDGLGDQSRDGVLDLAGSLTEILRDDLVEYTDDCWGRGVGIVRDPACASALPADHAARGTYFSESLGSAWLVLRKGISGSDIAATVGFRCAYDDTSP